MNPPDRAALEATFLQQVKFIERVTAKIGRHSGLTTDEIAEFCAEAKLHLIEKDYAVLASFREESTLTTFLVTVLTRCFYDYQAKRWGRFRSSAGARRLGPIAIALESLLFRRKLTLEEAGTRLRRESGLPEPTDEQLRAIQAQLKRPTVFRVTDSVDIETLTSADLTALDERPDALAETISKEENAALRRTLAALSPEDQRFLQLYYWEKLSMNDIGRLLHLETRPLFRRLERLLMKMRREMSDMRRRAE